MGTKRGPSIRLLLVAGLLALICAAAQTAGSAASWTIMVYLDADNNLEGAGIDDINELELAPSSLEVNVLVQIDRIPGYDRSNGNWTDTRRYLIIHDTTSLIRSVRVGPLLGELNMGDPQTLVNFVQWGIANYPADHYLLVLWDHGSGWKKAPAVKPHKGIAWDDTNGDYLSTAEMSSALSTIRAGLGRNLDIVACDACLMQMAELAYQIRGVADYYVASEETIPWDGYPYDEWLTALTATPSMSAAQLCGVLVETYNSSYNNGSQGSEWVTLSAVDLSKVGEVATAVDGLGSALGNAMSSWCQHIITYLSGTQSYADWDYKDLYHFAQMMQDYVIDDGVSAAAEAVKSAVTGGVVANGSVGSAMAESHGLSFYYPYPEPYSAGYGELSFATDTGWDTYISTDPPCDTYLPDQYELDDTAEQASLMAVGTTQADHWFHLVGDQDWASFDAEAGVRYAIETLNLGYWCDTVLSLYETDGATVLAWDDDSGAEWGASLVDWLCPSSAAYYVCVEHYWPDLTGLQTQYDLRVTKHRFGDVLPSHWAFSYIEACAQAGIVGGFEGGLYRPDLEVSRDQMAVFVSRALAGGEAYVPSGPAVADFDDVPTDHWAYKYVEYAYANNVVAGYAPRIYGPAIPVDRGQMAVFIARSLVLPSGDAGVPDPVGDPTFPDVTSTNSWAWCYKHVEFIADRGITHGYEDAKYHPEYICTRDQMAVFVARAFELPM